MSAGALNVDIRRLQGKRDSNEAEIVRLQQKAETMLVEINKRGQVIMYDRPTALVLACGSQGYPSDLNSILQTCSRCSAMNEYFCKMYYERKNILEKTIPDLQKLISDLDKDIAKKQEQLNAILQGNVNTNNTIAVTGFLKDNMIWIVLIVGIIAFVILKRKRLI